MTRIRSLYAMAAAWGLALAALGGATAAHAHNNDVTWSVGVGVPGVVVGATNGRPYYAPPPVYYAPRPVYYGRGYYAPYYPRHHYYRGYGRGHWAYPYHGGYHHHDDD